MKNAIQQRVLAEMQHPNIGNPLPDAVLKSALAQETYKIRYFDNKTQSIKEELFTGENAWEKAYQWSKSNLENFNSDIIQRVW